jgi:hypothetical protein
MERQKLYDLVTSSDDSGQYDLDDADRVENYLASDAGGLSIADLVVTDAADGHNEVGYQEIHAGGARRKLRKTPEWLGYMKVGNHTLRYNDQTMEVVYQKFPLLRQDYSKLQSEDQKKHKAQMQQAAQIMAIIGRWYFQGLIDDAIGEELGLETPEVKAIRRSFINAGNTLHSNPMKYQAKVRFTKRLRLSEKKFDEWEMKFNSNGHRKPSVKTSWWLPEPFSCQQPDRILAGHWLKKILVVPDILLAAKGLHRPLIRQGS